MKKFYFLLAGMLAASSGAFAQTTVNYNYTGSVQTFTVPPCVTTITVDLRGGAGGNKNTAVGGNGGRVQCTMTVTPGEVLNIYVGGAGVNGDNVSGVIAGGFNGGGTGFDDSDPWGGGGGGGASDIRRTPYTLNDRVVVAGGGGGGGIDGCGSSLLNGGAGGGLTGGNGQPSPSSCVGSGQGGTQSAGGLKGQYTGCNNSSTDGAFGTGGTGYGNCSNGDDGGAGGGGGWYGGGGGNFGAGGGGSSYTNGTCSSVTHTQGFQSGAGFVSITYTNGTIPSQPGVITGPASVCAGTTQTYSISTVSGATSYSWTVPGGSTINSGNGTTSISVTFGTSSGNISVTANNACGSSAAQTLAVTVHQLPSLTLTPTNVTCNGACNGSISPSATGGQSPYTYSPPSLSNLCAGNYTVTVTDAFGCTNNNTTTITQPSPLVSTAFGNANICNGSCTTLTGAASGGTPTYTYAWMPGNLTGSSVSVCPTTLTVYTLTVTDANNCTSAYPITVNVNQNPSLSLSPMNVTCNGSCDGMIMPTATGGTSPYTYSPSQLNNLCAGNYTVTVTDANGCTANNATTITQPSQLVSTAFGGGMICSGNCVNIIGAASGGTPGYSYVWMPGNLSGTSASVCPTTLTVYTLTVTDANNCTSSSVVTVAVNQGPNVSYVQSPSNACVNWPAFTLSAGSPNGGTYSGTGVSGNTFDPSVSGSGTFYVVYTYTDQNGCTGMDSSAITVGLCTGITGTNDLRMDAR